jgi:hypothetical protein
MWNLIANLLNLPSFSQISLTGGPVQWAKHFGSSRSKEEKRRKMDILFDFWWAI